MPNRDFKSLVRAFQTEGDRTIIERIYSYMPIDFREYGARRTDEDGNVKLDLPDHAMYITYRIKTLYQRVMSTRRYTIPLDMDDLREYARGIRNDLGYMLTEEDDFAALTEHFEEIRDYLDPEPFAGLLYFVQCYRQNEKNRHLVNGMVLEALERALRAVDPERTEREMVKYVNRAFHSEFLRLQMEKHGTKRLETIDEGGKRTAKYVTPTYKDSDAWTMVFETDIRTIGIERVMSEISEAQAELAQQVHDIIVRDFLEQDRDYIASNYKVGFDGKYKIKFRYIAHQIGLNEANLRHRLNRVRAKVRDIYDRMNRGKLP